MIPSWEKIAVKQLKEVAGYIENNFGKKRKNVFLSDVAHTIGLLESNPYMGALDPLLSGRAKSYRSIIINRLDKMVYYIDGDIVHIAAFWDCRREPFGQARHLK